MDDHLDAVVAELCDRHGCHTVILYGSRARGDATPESDIDVLGIRAHGPAVRDARAWRGTWLDAFVQPEAELRNPGEEQLKLVGARILVERGETGRRLLAAVDRLHAAGPAPLAEDDAVTRRSWMYKMIERAGREDVEAHYRRHWLLYQALEDYFALRGRWYRGPKESFTWLAAHDPETYRAFQTALALEADLGDIRALIDRVVAEPGP